MHESTVMQLPVPGPSDRSAASSVDSNDRPLSLRVGYDMQFDVPGPSPTAMVLMLFAHPEIAGRLETAEHLRVEPEGLPVETYLDPMGNRCARVVVPPGGTLCVTYDNVFKTTYAPEPQPQESTPQAEAGLLPTDVLPFLLGSRYCEIDRLSAIAWDLFGKLPPGGARALVHCHSSKLG
ncbi:MAG TPA: hypothetical protein VIM11_01910 [Tepidisphaeraceae bacterium]